MGNPFEVMQSEWTVWKYSIPLSVESGLHGDVFEILMPRTAIPFSVGCQYNKPVLWAMVDKSGDDADAKDIKRFLLCGTGNPLMKHPKLLKPLGTILLNDGHFILHVFEII